MEQSALTELKICTLVTPATENVHTIGFSPPLCLQVRSPCRTDRQTDRWMGDGYARPV